MASSAPCFSDWNRLAVKFSSMISFKLGAVSRSLGIRLGKR